MPGSQAVTALGNVADGSDVDTHWILDGFNRRSRHLGVLTNTLYSLQNAIGFNVLLPVILRIVVKIRLKGPPYPTLFILGDYYLPTMPFVPKDEEPAARLFCIHGWLAIMLSTLIADHIAAALRHLLRKDGFSHRMV